MFKFVVASANLAVAIATTIALPDGRILTSTYAADGNYNGPYAYGPAPYKEEKLASQPLAYEYGVADDFPKDNFKKTDEYEFVGLCIALPDGRIMTTTYTADHYNGFIDEVTYEGTPVYPYEPAFGETNPASAPYKEEKLIPYSYEYGVNDINDDYSKTKLKKVESQDANGNVQGSIVITLPDGRIQTTTYTADHNNGFIAEVTYDTPLP